MRLHISQTALAILSAAGNERLGWNRDRSHRPGMQEPDDKSEDHDNESDDHKRFCVQAWGM
jgi:hypothetical protein